MPTLKIYIIKIGVNTLEILAPVGGREQLIAAVRSGADAVYLGTSAFNARRNAENFGAFELNSIVQYCHGRGVKVYVTVNTLVFDREQTALLDEIEIITKAGPDAVIVQDLGVASLWRECCPDMPIHASTQMTIHDLNGAAIAKQLGFTRIVPARELNLSEIRTIHNSGLEIECFVHGALCMCISGGCYLSAVLGGRSGNRGMCAQPCRLNFTAPSGRSYALSLKDMSYISHIKELQDAGVCSLKIEGRMKRPEYVAAAVTACRAALNGSEPDMEKLKAVFSRSGFTDGYLTGQRNLNMFGSRSLEDIKASSSVLSHLTGLYRTERASTAVNMQLVMSKNAPCQLTVTDGTVTTSCSGEPAQNTVSRPTDMQTARRYLSRTGGTPFYLNKLEISSPGNLTLPTSSLNSLRRNALEKLLTLRSVPIVRTFHRPEIKPQNIYRPKSTHIRLRFQTLEQFFDDENCEIVIPLKELVKNPELIKQLGSRLLCELPAMHFDSLDQQLSSLKSIGLKKLLGGNIGDFEIAKRHMLELHGGHGLNILNTRSLNEYAKLGLIDATLSFEMNMKSIEQLGGSISRGIIAYGHLPLMNMRVCPAQGKNGCGNCSGYPVLKDRKGVIFPLICYKKKYVTLLNSLPLDIMGKYIAPLDFLTLYFTLESKAECKQVLSRYLNRQKSSSHSTGGLYYRELK